MPPASDTLANGKKPSSPERNGKDEGDKAKPKRWLLF